jgi:hypothetical protein
MLKIWGKIIKDNRIIRDEVVTADVSGTYQDNLKACLTEICYKLDISKPYWLPYNLEEYNKRSKTTFTKYNFIEEVNYDKFVIEEIKLKNNKS